MTGLERQILEVVSGQSPADAASVARSMGVSEGYVAPLMVSLAGNGYLEDAEEGRYTITREGAKMISHFAGRDSGGVFVSRFP